MNFFIRNGDSLWAASGGEREGGREAGISRTDSRTINRVHIAPEQDNRALLHSTHCYRLLTLCQGSSPGDTCLSSLVMSTSLLNVSISPCLLGAPRELTGVNGSLPEFCGKDKMHMLLLFQCSVFGNEQFCIVMQTPR